MPARAPFALGRDTLDIDRWVTLGAVAVRLRGADPAAAAVLDEVIRYLQGECGDRGPEPHIEFEVRAGTPPEAAPSAQTLTVFDNGFSLEREGEAVVLRGASYAAYLDVPGGRGTAWVPPALEGPRRWTACGVVLQGLLFLLRRHRLYSLHAAALVHEGRGALIAAAADSGKSTLSFRLVQSGWGYLSDDTVLLRPTPEGVEMRGLRSHFSLDPDAEEVFPEIAAGREPALLKEEKWAVNVEAIYPGQRVDACAPALLLFPRITGAAESRTLPLTAPDALHGLLAQSSLARLALEGADEHRAVLARLAAGVPAYRLEAGRDLLEDPARASALLAPLLTG